MLVELLRFSSGEFDTLGLLHIDGEFFGFTLEDRFQQEKVMHETRIPAGRYKIGLRMSPKFKRNMLHLLNVPNFEFIYIHAGNDHKDTSGCLLVGDEVANRSGERTILQSRVAYERVYNKIAPAVKAGEDVWIQVRNWR